MNLYFRILLVWLVNRRRPALGHADSVTTHHRVWPLDIDLFGHMNNGRYLQVMDVSRLVWMFRVGVVRAMLQNRWSAVIGGAVVRFRRALRPLEAYRIETRLLSWDARWWFLEHRVFNRSDQTVAVAVTRCALRDATGWVTTDRVLAAVSPGATPPIAPEVAASWFVSEDAICGGLGLAAGVQEL